MEDREKLLHALFDAVRAVSAPTDAWPSLQLHGAFAEAALRRWAELRGIAVEVRTLSGTSGQWDTVLVDFGVGCWITVHLDDHIVAAAGAQP